MRIKVRDRLSRPVRITALAVGLDGYLLPVVSPRDFERSRGGSTSRRPYSDLPHITLRCSFVRLFDTTPIASPALQPFQRQFGEIIYYA